ncbi:AI-2E family transporter [Babesia caballi]|uniref:AI-2E family transporter n=1 Tax=Babesia caballi TaxID=5871 RepID=A0AAV4LMI3_BABCB|nr:AI-2E family transporter [Babesia caballi]
MTTTGTSEISGLEANFDMAHGTGGMVVKAEAPEVIGQEGLEWGSIGMFAAFFMFAACGVVTACMLALATLNRTYVGQDNLVLTKTHIDFLPIFTLSPAAALRGSKATLLVQKAKLKLEGVSIIRKSIEQPNARGIRQVKLGVTEKTM